VIRAIVVDTPDDRRSELAKACRAAGIRAEVVAYPARQLVNALMRRSFDVVLVSLDLAGLDRPRWRSIVSAAQPAPVLVLTDDPQDPALVSAIAEGVRGAILRDHPERAGAAVKTAVNGGVALPRASTKLLVDTIAQQQDLILGNGAARQLTGRERQVLGLLRQGRTTGQIAHDLGVAPVTVRTHISSALRKLAVEDRAGAIALLKGQPSA
jgi:DNA-binding NarL/FixJ family response regulator